MINFLVSWTEQLLIALIIIVIIEMVIPTNSSHKKYINTILGAFLIYCVISPFVNNKIKNINFNEVIDKKKMVLQNSNTINNDKQIEEMFKIKFKDNLSEFIKEKGYELVELDENIEYKNQELLINTINLEIRKIENEDSIRVDTIQIRKVNKIENERIEDLKEQISKYYEIEKTKINISESEK